MGGDYTGKRTYRQISKTRLVASRPAGKKLVSTLSIVIVSIALLSMAFTVGVYANPGMTFSTIVEEGGQVETASYVVFRDGSTYHAKNGTTGAIDVSTSNATLALENCFTGLTNGRTWKEKIMLCGNFTLDTTLYVPSYTTIELQGRIKFNDLGSDGIRNEGWTAVLGSSSHNEYIEIFGGEIEGVIGAAAGSSVDKAIVFDNVTCAKIHDISIHDCYGYAVRLDYSNNVDIYGLTIDDVGTASHGGDGILVGNCFDVKIHHNTISDTSDDAIAVDHPTGGKQTFVTGNWINKTGTAFGNGIGVYSGNGTVVKGNTVFGGYSQSAGILLEYFGGQSVYNCEVSNNHVMDACYGIRLNNYGYRSVISNNVVERNRGQGIILINCGNLSVTGNVVMNNAQNASLTAEGIRVENTNCSVFVGNICSDDQATATQDWGITEVGTSDYNIFMACEAFSNQLANILMDTAEASSNSRIVGCYNGTTWVATWGTG